MTVLFDSRFDNRDYGAFDNRQSNSLNVIDCSNGKCDSFVQGMRPNDVAMRITLSDWCAVGAHASEVTRIVPNSGSPWDSYVIGATEFVGIRFRLPSPFYTPTDFAVAPQIKYPTIRYHPIGITFQSADNKLYLDVNAGKSANDTTNYDPVLGWQLWRYPIVDGVQADAWYEFIFEIKWATQYGAGGYIKLWKRVVTDPLSPPSWTLAFDSTVNNYAAYIAKGSWNAAGTPTLQWGMELGNVRFSDENGLITSGSGVGTYKGFIDHFGMYRGGAAKSSGSSLQPNTVIDWDRYVVGESFADVEGVLNTNGRRDPHSLFPTTGAYTGTLGVTTHVEPELRFKVTSVPAADGNYVEVTMQKQDGNNYYVARIQNFAGVLRTNFFSRVAGITNSKPFTATAWGFVNGSWMGVSYRGGAMRVFTRAAAQGSPWVYVASMRHTALAAVQGTMSVATVGATYDAATLMGGNAQGSKV